MLNNEKQTSVAVMYCRFMYNEFIENVSHIVWTYCQGCFHQQYVQLTSN